MTRIDQINAQVAKLEAERASAMLAELAKHSPNKDKANIFVSK